jgi:hypothetical protein
MVASFDILLARRADVARNPIAVALKAPYCARIESIKCLSCRLFNRALRQQPPLIKAALNGGNLRNLGRIVRYKLS